MKFTIIPADYFIWNYDALLEFLVNNQNNDIIIHSNEEGCCLTSVGLYKTLDLFEFNSVEIQTTNIVETHEKYKVVIIPRAFKFFEAKVEYNEYHCWNDSHVFGGLYNRAIWHRIGLASHLLTNHNDISLVNFRSDPHDQDQRSLFELQKLFEFDVNSAKNFITLTDCLPKQLEQNDGYTVGATTTQHTDQLKEFYVDFLIDIVAETFTTGRCFFPTEKTVRPMLLKKPFIVMGPKCFLIHLRQMGFKTFYEFWDEDYDGYGEKDRYLKILELIDSIANKSQSELREMYNNMQSILEHNHTLLMTRAFTKTIEYVE